MQTTVPMEKEPIVPATTKNTVMALFLPPIKSGPCKYLDGTRKQNHQCRRDAGLPEAIKEARRLALSHCEEQFRYDRWNCSIETRGKRNIFKKVIENCVKRGKSNNWFFLFEWKSKLS